MECQGRLSAETHGCGRTLFRRHHLAGDHARVPICSQEHLSSGLSPGPVPRPWPSEHLLDKKVSLYFSAAFSAPGSKLQAVDDHPRLAPGSPELHEDTTVSFQPGSEQTQPGDRRGDRKLGWHVCPQLVSKCSLRLVRAGMEGCSYVRA